MPKEKPIECLEMQNNAPAITPIAKPRKIIRRPVIEPVPDGQLAVKRRVIRKVPVPAKKMLATDAPAVPALKRYKHYTKAGQKYDTPLKTDPLYKFYTKCRKNYVSSRF